MKVLLDTNFIVGCIRKKIDFISRLQELGFTPLLPKEVLEELKDLKREARQSREDRTAIDVALQMFENSKIEKISLGNKSTDMGLIDKGKNGYYVATLDKAMKHTLPNLIVINDAKKDIEVERK